ncbi:MAG TPA: thioredoxin TrxC [Burkholderiales bacterium]|nr:thioredoxin TrxC [Burkholderiales bacterium]
MSAALHVVCGRCGAVNRVPAQRLEQSPNCGRCKGALLDGAPVELTGERFDRFIERNDLPVVVDFWADWCAPCKMMAPVFAQAAREQRTRLRMAKLDTDAQGAIAQRYAIRSIPTLVAFKGGREVDRVSGALDPARLRAWLSAITG